MLGTTPHTVYRRHPASAGRHLDAADVAALQSEIGSIPKGWPLSRTDAFVIAALDRHPFGARSIRTVARWAGVSPTAAARALARLEGLGLLRREVHRVVEHHARDVDVWAPDNQGAAWRALADLIDLVRLPAARPAPHPSTVPQRLWQHFWNHPSPGTIDLNVDGRYVAARLLQSLDSEAVAWAATRLSSSDLASVATLRGVDPGLRRLALNLAAAS